MATYGKITSGGDFVYFYKLDNFLKRPEANGKSFNSPNIAVTDNNGKNGTIFLEIFPKGDSQTSTHVSIYIMNESISKELDLSYRLGPYLNF